MVFIACVHQQYENAAMRDISDIFKKSPFELLQEHMNRVHKCALLLRPLFEALANENYDKVNEIALEISKAESLCDEQKRATGNSLSKNVLLPVSRRDMIQVLNAQDSIADTTEDIANLLTLRETKIPEKLKDELFNLIDANLESCKEAKEATDSLEELFKRSFGGPEIEHLYEMLDSLDSCKMKTKKLCTNLQKDLFAMEDELPAISVMIWFKLIDEISKLAYHCKRMGNRLRILIAK